MKRLRESSNIEQAFKRIETSVNRAEGKLTYSYFFNRTMFELEDDFSLTEDELEKVGQMCKEADSNSSKKESLKSYLQKKLTINSKEAELIESVIKTYVRNKKQK